MGSAGRRSADDEDQPAGRKAGEGKVLQFEFLEDARIQFARERDVDLADGSARRCVCGRPFGGDTCGRKQAKGQDPDRMMQL